VQQRTRGSVSSDQASNVGERLDDTGLVVDQLDRDQNHLSVEQLTEAVQIDQAVGADWSHPNLLAAGGSRLQHCGMLHRAYDNRARARRNRSQHSQVVGLSPA
jgi:hypothetical protein